MLKKLFSLFSLENKIISSVGAHLQKSEMDNAARLNAFETRVFAGTQQLDKLEMGLNKRLTRLESLFETELLDKEKQRDELVRAKRLGK